MAGGSPNPSTLGSAGADRRVAVVGTTGAGKTTLARHLAHRLAVPHVELDALYWGPNWTPVSADLFHQRTALAVTEDAWVIDGNYHLVRDLVWSRATTVVWLDYPLSLILARLLKRTVRRILAREELWSGNLESLRQQFLSGNSIFLWGLKTYGRRRREYPALFKETAYSHLTVVRLSSPRATEDWLARVSSRADQPTTNV